MSKLQGRAVLCKSVLPSICLSVSPSAGPPPGPLLASPEGRVLFLYLPHSCPILKASAKSRDNGTEADALLMPKRDAPVAPRRTAPGPEARAARATEAAEDVVKDEARPERNQ